MLIQHLSQKPFEHFKVYLRTSVEPIQLKVLATLRHQLLQLFALYCFTALLEVLVDVLGSQGLLLLFFVVSGQLHVLLQLLGDLRFLFFVWLVNKRQHHIEKELNIFVR